VRGSWSSVPAGIVALALVGCGGGAHQTTRAQASNETLKAVIDSMVSRSPLTGVLAIPSVGEFKGRCAQGADAWTLRFVDDTGVNDRVYEERAGRLDRPVDVRPGGALTWHLVPGVRRSYEPPDPLSNNPARTVPSTTPLTLIIEQGSEPHIFRVDATIALAAAIGDTTNCALVSSAVRALTYFTGGGPATP
jgi:hypothetical protein